MTRINGWVTTHPYQPTVILWDERAGVITPAYQPAPFILIHYPALAAGAAQGLCGLYSHLSDLKGAIPCLRLLLPTPKIIIPAF